MIKNSREAVLNALNGIEKNKAYSNLLFDDIINKANLNTKDNNFATKLFYGVLEYKITLDYCISQYVKKGIKSLQIEILNILRMGFYELLFMDSAKEYASVNESVKLCKAIRVPAGMGLVNAVMRSFIRNNKNIRLPDKKNSASDYYSIKYSCPKWLFECFVHDYGFENAVNICKASIGSSPINIRLNNFRVACEDLIANLKKSGAEIVLNPYLKKCAEIKYSGNITSLSEYKNGYFHIQNFSSQLCAEITLSLCPDGGTIFDICAAPGGKSFTMAQNSRNVSIFSSDLHKSRVELINQGINRLGLDKITTRVYDAAIFDESIPKADTVLCDAPCSGYGVIRSKPEIKYKNQDEQKELPGIQLKILKNASKYVNSGGFLVYSTCTLSRNENENVINNFLIENVNFMLYNDGVYNNLPEQISKFTDINKFGFTIFPFTENGEFYPDGFFISILKRV